jgi:hypothetical protein
MNKHSPSQRQPIALFPHALSRLAPRGFALIATISIMALLVMIALAMLSLSTIELRASQNGRAVAEAQANARMALMLALGELQKQMGPDQRISAKGAIVSQTDVLHPHWTGVWNSWKAGNGEASQHQTIQGVSATEMAPTYLPARSDYFRSWLLSLDPTEATTITSANDLTLNGNPRPDSGDTAIRLVGEGSLGQAALAKDYVSARLLSVAEPTDPSKIAGRYGWWVGDESQKARIMADSYNTAAALTNADKIFRSQAPGSMGNKMISGLESIKDEQDLDKLPSLKTIDLVELGTPPANGAPEVSQLNFHNATIHSHGVLADVREGGLKRDLSTILEQPIRVGDNGQEFMLYEFDDPRFPDRSNSHVPIQDLSAYYQLYDNDPNWSEGRRGGISYNSTALPNSIQITTPDYDGATKNREKYQREYTTLYKQPVMTKVQFLLAIGAQWVTDIERQQILDRVTTQTPRGRTVAMRDSDTDKLLLGIMPVVTLWNPNNVPMVMDSSQILRFGTPPFALRWRKYRDGVTKPKDFNYFNLNYAMGGSSVTTGVAVSLRPHILRFRLARNSRIVFEPGEVKLFSAPSDSGGTLTEIGDVAKFRDTLTDPVNSWDPNGFFLMPRSTPHGAWNRDAPDAYSFKDAGGSNNSENMVFGREDRLSLEIVTEAAGTSYQDGRRISHAGEISGAGFTLSMFDEGYYDWRDSLDFLRHYQMLSRHGSKTRDNEVELAAFNADLLTPGFPGGEGIVNFTDKTNAIQCADIIDATAAGDFIGLMDFSLSYGCEVSSNSVGGFAGGRRVASRPFLHAGLNAAPFIDQADNASLYNYGWDWQLSKINNVEDSIVQGEAGTGRGYFGGGYTIEAGTTHVVQREIPVLPPISIASLSHVHLGGFSLAQTNIMGDNPDTDKFWWKNSQMRQPTGTAYQQITATGNGGLAPHVVQAIGNSYAHPNIPSDRAFITNWERYFDVDEDPVNIPFVDHSYLANKALWDEYFFSSITPQAASVELYGGTARNAEQVASDFFINGAALPNRRIMPHSVNMDGDVLDDMFAEYDLYNNGFADKIAAHLMVDGSFNINSTSVEAWKILFSSLKGKPSVYLESGKTPSETTPDGTVIGHGALLTAEPIAAGSITSPNSPSEQWKAGRELSDDEIEKLATAMVKQVKLRGPFLSLSEFINRRLDSSNEELALKGALQAAIDDPDVPINAQFRETSRMLDAETAAINFEFDAAADGPIAYGSAAYVDQADVLRGLASQLTPRGDTFIIRTYGDSLGSDGKVLARAWCEAVVQRVPEYINSTDEAYVKQADLVSDENKRFGRKLKIISFRWLNAEEI